MRRLGDEEIRVQGSKFKVQGLRFKVQSSRFKVQGLRFFVFGEFLEEAGGDVGGDDGHDAFDGYDESFVALDALDVAFGAFEGPAGYAHMLPFFEINGARVQVFEVGMAAGGYQLEGVHLLVGDDGGVPGAAVPVQDNPAIETFLDLFCP